MLPGESGPGSPRMIAAPRPGTYPLLEGRACGKSGRLRAASPSAAGRWSPAVEAVRRRVLPATREGGRGRRPSEKEVVQDVDRVGEVHRPGVIRIRRVGAGWLCLP